MQTHNDDWDELLRSLGPEDPQVIEVLIEQHEQYIYRLSCAILNNTDDAKDISQETFIIAAKKLAQYQPGTNIRGWLYTIAVNQARRLMQKSKARNAMLQILGQEPRPLNTNSSPEKNSLLNDNKKELWAAVGELGEKHRIPIILRMIEGLTIKEIAKILSIKEKTVYSRLYDGFRILKATLWHEPDFFPEREVREL